MRGNGKDRVKEGQADKKREEEIEGREGGSVHER